MTWRFDWDDAAIARLTELWLAGYSSGECARRLGVSRSSAIGKLNRLGLLRNSHRPLMPRSMPGKAIPVPKPVPQKVPNKRNKRPSLPPWPIPAASLPPPPPAYGTLSLLDLRHNSCRWPEGDGPVFVFCGRPQAGGSSYCPDHLARSMSGQARGTLGHLARLGQG